MIRNLALGALAFVVVYVVADTVRTWTEVGEIIPPWSDKPVVLDWVPELPADDGRPDFSPPPGALIACKKGAEVMETRPGGNAMLEFATWVCKDPDARNQWGPTEEYWREKYGDGG